jgi:hypothetical protein
MPLQPNKLFYNRPSEDNSVFAAAHKATGGAKGVIAGGITGGNMFFLNMDRLLIKFD